jgi:integrase
MQTLTPELQKLLTQISQHLQSEPVKNPPLLEIWDAWVADLNLSRETRSDHYANLRSQIACASPLASETSWLLSLEIAPATFNKKLGYLRACGDWAKSEGLLGNNSWLKVKPRKGSKEIITPFSKDEATRIIAGFEKSYPAWVSFTKFLFLSGCRMSEAIGLQWKHVDFERGEICICESLAQCKDGNGYERVRKSTKTGSVRYLKINTELAKLLTQVSRSQNSEDLIFKNPSGTSHIDSNNFRDRWKKVLAATNIPYRRPHVIRHSFASHAIEQGIPLTGVAYLLGHSDTRMVASTYGHLVNRPSLPNIL